MTNTRSRLSSLTQTLEPLAAMSVGSTLNHVVSEVPSTAPAGLISRRFHARVVRDPVDDLLDRAVRHEQGPWTPHHVTPMGRGWGARGRCVDGRLERPDRPGRGCPGSEWDHEFSEEQCDGKRGGRPAHGSSRSLDGASVGPRQRNIAPMDGTAYRDAPDPASSRVGSLGEVSWLALTLGARVAILLALIGVEC